MMPILLILLLVAVLGSAGYGYRAGWYRQTNPRVASVGLVPVIIILLVLVMIFGHFGLVTHTAP